MSKVGKDAMCYYNVLDYSPIGPKDGIRSGEA